MIFWLIGIAANFYSWFLDYDESRRKKYYGKQEGNLFFREKDGELDRRKAVIIFLLLEILPSVMMMLFLHHAKGEGQSDNIGYYAGACWNLGFALLHYITARKNIKRSKARRILQIAKRKEWQSGTWTREEFARTYLGSTRGNAGDTFLLLFAWIRVPTLSNYEETIYTLADALIAWSRLPDDQAWPDKKFHPGK